MPGIRIRLHKSYGEDYEQLSKGVKERLNSFYRQVSFDPDEQSILEVCGTGKDGSLAYPLGEGWVVYWKTIREKVYFTGLEPSKPIRVDLMGFHRFPEFIHVKFETKP